MTEAMLQHQSLRELIARKLRAQILGRELAPGQKVDVGAIAGQYGVSAGSVREAAFVLESEGLVVVNPRRGITVRVVTNSDLLEIYHVREVIDLAAGRLVAGLRDESIIQELREGQQRIERCWDEGGFAEGLAADLEFHVLLATASGNSRLVEISTNLTDQTRLYLQPVEVADTSIRQRPPSMLHLNMVEAIAEADDSRIREACAAHYAFSRTRIT